MNPVVRERGQILKIVRRYGTDGISVEAIDKIFIQAGKHLGSQIDEHIQYLCDPDKGYLRCEMKKDPFSGVERMIVSITARGIDLVSGIIGPDPGVDVAW